MKKTNALRKLDASKIKYEVLEYPVDESDLSGAHALEHLSLKADEVFKTLVLKGEKKGYVVCCIPVMEEIDLKKMAMAIGDKKVEMIPLKDLLSVTGYMRGGCSPIGMKKSFPTYFDQSCLNHEKMSVSAGARGLSIYLKTEDLIKTVQAECIDVTKIYK